jgi:hypothetical protein
MANPDLDLIARWQRGDRRDRDGLVARHAQALALRVQLRRE